MPARCCGSRGSQMRPERQVGQVGAELIGADGAGRRCRGDRGGRRGAGGDRGAASVGRHHPADPGAGDRRGLRHRRRRRRRHCAPRSTTRMRRRWRGSAGAAGGFLVDLLAAAGAGEAARAALDRLDLPSARRASATGSARCSTGSRRAMPALKVTVDPVENRGFEYHTGISFTFFARVDPELGPLGELGRGGRYEAGDPPRPSRRPASPSTPTRSCAPCRAGAAPPGAGAARRRSRRAPRALRDEGWITVAALRRRRGLAGRGAPALRCGPS